MLTRRILIALATAASLATAAHAQEPAPAPSTPPTPGASTNPKVVISTPQGDITVELYVDKAPITAKNFLKYVDRKLYDGATFYRASKPPGQAANDYGTVQGGLQNDPKKVLPPIPHESNLKTGILHTNGVISMGRHAPGTAQADWFICVGDMSYLDADPKDPKNPGFAAFGHVTSGMDVVQKILGMPTDPNRGEGAMKGEMLVKPVKITSVRRVTG
jgi:peptidyl-prolyl cis-trans isomerase A (cyclophilin A)